MRLIAFLLCAFFTFAIEAKPVVAQREVPTYIFVFKTIAAANAFRGTREIQVLNRVDHYVLVRSLKTPSLRQLQRQIPGLEMIEENGTISLAGSCPLMGSGKVASDENWDLHQANLDLMNEELKKLGVDPGKISIAIVDSGVDTGNQGLREGQITAADKKGDDLGHGTQVADRILHASPGSKVNSYKAFDKDGGAKEFDVIRSITRACADGNKVINFSAFSGRPLSTQRIYKKALEALEDDGCILVEASGNHAKGAPQAAYYDSFPDRKSVFNVGATNSTGELSGMSNPGVFMAPGEDVKMNSIGRKQVKRSGTSFATPVAAAVTKNVYSVLERSKDFNELTGAEKIKIVKKVMEQSSVKGRIDGYRAVVLANAVSKGMKTLLGDTDLGPYTLDTFSEERAKSVVNGNCASAGSCESQASCYRAKRKTVALSGADSAIEDLDDLLKTSEQNGESFFSSYWKANMPKKTVRTPAGSGDGSGSR